MRRATRAMTEGSIPRHLLRYAVPVILGDLFQLTYNTVDSVIVGKYAGAGALAAVGVAAPLMNVAMFFARSLRREFATALAISAAFSAAVALALFALAGPLLKLCRTPEEILADTARYLRIVAAGMVVTSLYNALAAASRSVGDTLTPLACLVAGSLLNVGLDLLFVARFALGAAGAAWATVIAQAMSAALCAAMLRRRERMLFAVRRDFRVDRGLLRRTLRFSYASALQQAGIYVGKLLVQSAVNPLGVSAIAAFNAVNRIDDYAIIPERDIASGETVLVAQNHGAGKPDRMRRGFWAAQAIEAGYGLALSIAAADAAVRRSRRERGRPAGRAIPAADGFLLYHARHHQRPAGLDARHGADERHDGRHLFPDADARGAHVPADRPDGPGRRAAGLRGGLDADADLGRRADAEMERAPLTDVGSALFFGLTLPRTGRSASCPGPCRWPRTG